MRYCPIFGGITAWGSLSSQAARFHGSSWRKEMKKTEGEFVGRGG
jgi:hypothetical protein